MYNQKAYELGTVGSIIRDLHAYGCQRAKEVGQENVYDFTIGNPSIPAPKQVADTIRRLLDENDPLQLHSYTSEAGLVQTRQAIADDLNARYHAGAQADQLFMTCGAAPAICAVFHALCVPNARILAVAPFFPEYRPYVEQTGAEFAVVPADVPDFQIRLDKVEEMLTPGTVAIIINSPNNPSGTVYTQKTLEQLGALLKKKAAEFGHPIYIVADEPYRELVYGGVEVPFIPNIYPDTIVCYSYSKSLSLPGQRIGYVYVPAQATDSRAIYAAVGGAARFLGHICAPSLSQQIIASCAHLRPDLESYDKNRQALYEGLLAAGYQVAKPDGAFYMFVKAPGGSAAAFSEFAKQFDLLVVPGDDFGCSEYFRASYCVSYEQIQRSIPVFAKVLQEYTK